MLIHGFRVLGESVKYGWLAMADSWSTGAIRAVSYLTIHVSIKSNKIQSDEGSEALDFGSKGVP